MLLFVCSKVVIYKCDWIDPIICRQNYQKVLELQLKMSLDERETYFEKPNAASC